MKKLPLITLAVIACFFVINVNIIIASNHYSFGSKFTLVYYNDFENIQENNVSGITIGPTGVAIIQDQAIGGEYSILLSNLGSIRTDPSIIKLEPNTVYSFEFDYKILDRGNEYGIVTAIFQKSNSNEFENTIWPRRSLLANSELSGTFSAGVLTNKALSYDLSIGVTNSAKIIIDNLRIYRKDKYPITEQIPAFKLLNWKPFPRLGNYLGCPTMWLEGQSCVDGHAYTLTVNEIENKLAFYDVIVGVNNILGTDPDFVRRMKTRNPSIIILPYELATEFGPPDMEIAGETVDPQVDFALNLKSEWIVKDIDGYDVEDVAYPGIKKMNLSDFCPVVQGKTWNQYHLNYIFDEILNTGLWDGIYFDQLIGRIHGLIPNNNDPLLLNFDINVNGLRDETPAYVNDITRFAVIELLNSLRDIVKDLKLIIGNIGCTPEMALAPYVNGYVFECWDQAWAYEGTSPSETLWRQAFDNYNEMLSKSVSPKVTILQGCGGPGSNKVQPGCDLTDADFQRHRFILGSTLLSDGFYEYDTWDMSSGPFWFDEYSVNENGVSVENLSYKGFLGMALNEAFEMKSNDHLIWEQDFDDGKIPKEMNLDSGVYVSSSIDEVIDGTGSLILENKDYNISSETYVHTISSYLKLLSGKSYIIEFDWKVIETLNDIAIVSLWGVGHSTTFGLNGIVKGDAGKVHMPVMLDSGANYEFAISLTKGGGKLSIDNLRISETELGPWRRDFENGFVLVNPLRHPYTFNSNQLSGPYNRRNIKRILGSQAPSINNGQPVTDGLTLNAFDAIILLSDPLRLPSTMEASIDSLEFGECEIGKFNVKILTVKNTSTDDIELDNVISENWDYDDFSITFNSCDKNVIAPDESCEIEITFEPSSLGPKQSELNTISNVKYSSLLKTSLNGTAISSNSNDDNDNDNKNDVDNGGGDNKSDGDSGGGSGGGGCFILTVTGR